MKCLKSIYLSLLLGFSLTSLQAQNVFFSDDFNDCSVNEDWEFVPVVGELNWILFPLVSQLNPDGGCIAGVADNQTGGGDPFRITQFRSRWIQPFEYETVWLEWDMIFVKSLGELLNVYLEKQDGKKINIRTFNRALGAPNYDTYIHQEYELQLADYEPFRLVFELDNGGTAGSLIIMDNVVFRGPENTSCDQAMTLTIDSDCFQGNSFKVSEPDFFTSCSDLPNKNSMWYQFVAEQSGVVKFNTGSDYNEIITMYQGNCSNMNEVECLNRDEFGFTGETLYFPVQEGETYLFRVSGLEGNFGAFEGNLCIQLESLPAMPSAPSNDLCMDAIPLESNGLCVEGSNYFANTQGPTPSKNYRTRHDVWYSYTPSTNEPFTVVTNADFSDVITIFSGDCNNLVEVAGNDQGHELTFISAEAGVTYYIQIAGYFASIEGNFCIEIVALEQGPDNPMCALATSIPISEDCIEGDNFSASFSGIKPSCDLKPGGDVWYSFMAPPSGDIYLHMSAEFLYTMAIYRGDCDSLIQVFCERQPESCQEYLRVENLEPGTQYYLQILSSVSSIGHSYGNFCLRVMDQDETEPYAPLKLDVEINCIRGVIAQLNIDVSAGDRSFVLEGTTEDEMLFPGDSYFVVVTDENDCRKEAFGTIECQGAPANCDDSNLEIVTDIQCVTNSLGLNTGEAVFNYTATGGAGDYIEVGTQSGTTLQHGDSYTVFVVDADSCVQQISGTIDCPEYSCDDDSDLDLNVSYECIDSLLRARLVVEASNGIGQYTFVGNQNDELLETGVEYTTKVIDEAGCEIEITGEIECDFDSCAYSNIQLDIEVQCVVNNEGKQTGYGVLVMNYTGGQGSVIFNGNQPGDTLAHGEFYEVTIIDDWGCDSYISGVVSCVNTAANQIEGLLSDRVYPVPSSQVLYLELTSDRNTRVNYSILDLSGQIIYQRNADLHSGTQVEKFDVGNYASGMYLIRMDLNGATKYHRFIKS